MAALRSDFDLTAARRDRGWSKAQAARETDVGYATWCRAEEHGSISEASAKAIADAFGLTVSTDFPESPVSEKAGA